MCLWDTFSNEHGVVGLDFRLVEIDSCRGAGGFIAKLNRQTAESKYDYMDFKMKAELKKIHREAIEDSKEQPVRQSSSPIKMFMTRFPTVGRRGNSTSAGINSRPIGTRATGDRWRSARRHGENRGVGVIGAWAAGMRERSDEEHLLWAAAQKRTLYGFNVRDYCRLHAQ